MARICTAQSPLPSRQPEVGNQLALVVALLRTDRLLALKLLRQRRPGDFDNEADAHAVRELTGVVTGEITVPVCLQHIRFFAQSPFWRLSTLDLWCLFGPIIGTSKKFLFDMRALQDVCQDRDDAITALRKAQAARRDRTISCRGVRRNVEWAVDDVRRALAAKRAARRERCVADSPAADGVTATATPQRGRLSAEPEQQTRIAEEQDTRTRTTQQERHPNTAKSAEPSACTEDADSASASDIINDNGRADDSDHDASTSAEIEVGRGPSRTCVSSSPAADPDPDPGTPDHSARMMMSLDGSGSDDNAGSNNNGSDQHEEGALGLTDFGFPTAPSPPPSPSRPFSTQPLSPSSWPFLSAPPTPTQHSTPKQHHHRCVYRQHELSTSAMTSHASNQEPPAKRACTSARQAMPQQLNAPHWHRTIDAWLTSYLHSAQFTDVSSFVDMIRAKPDTNHGALFQLQKDHVEHAAFVYLNRHVRHVYCFSTAPGPVLDALLETVSPSADLCMQRIPASADAAHDVANIIAVATAAFARGSTPSPEEMNKKCALVPEFWLALMEQWWQISTQDQELDGPDALVNKCRQTVVVQADAGEQTAAPNALDPTSALVSSLNRPRRVLEEWRQVSSALSAWRDASHHTVSLVRQHVASYETARLKSLNDKLQKWEDCSDDEDEIGESSYRARKLARYRALKDAAESQIEKMRSWASRLVEDAQHYHEAAQAYLSRAAKLKTSCLEALEVERAAIAEMELA